MNIRCDNYMRPTALYSSRKIKTVFISTFLICFFIFTHNDFSYSEKVDVILANTMKPKPLTKALSKESLITELEINQVICPDEVFAQILIESGNLKSFLTKRTNNLLGMRYPFRRNTSAIGLFLPSENRIVIGTKEELKQYKSRSNYAVYASWEDCIKDYKLWQENNFKLSEIYLKFLGSCYAEDPAYVEKIKQMTR